MNELYINIKSLCDSRGITPSYLAKELGFSKNFFTELKSERVKSCSASRLFAIAEYFGVDADSIVNGKNAVRVPIYGQVPAGIPTEAIEDIDGYEEITPELAAKGKYIALRIRGDSMTPQICSGDTVIIDLCVDAGNGDTVIVSIDGETTCKKIKKDENGIWLMPNNPAYEPMYFTNAEIEALPVRMIGKVIELRRSF